jgi:LysR family transcriptional regulator, nitrogen assimilation regulatory protein
MIDLRQLSYFIAVVEAKSVTAAAEVLHIAQPALSQHMQRLEQELGQQLLVRHSRGIEPTDAGFRLLDHARAILKSVETATHDVRHFREEQRGTVRLGMPRSLCETLGVQLMSAWPQQHPNVNLQIVEQLSNTLTEWLLAGRLDLALTYSPDDSNMLSAEPLLQEKMCALMPAHQGPQRLGEIQFIALARERLILHSSAYVNRQIIDTTAKYCSVKLNVAYEVESIDLTLNMVEANLGWSIQPYLTVRRLMDMGRLAVGLIVAPHITGRLHLMHSLQRPLAPYEVKVCEAIKKHLHDQFANGQHSPLIELEFTAES